MIPKAFQMDQQDCGTTFGIYYISFMQKCEQRRARHTPEGKRRRYLYQPEFEGLVERSCQFCLMRVYENKVYRHTSRNDVVVTTLLAMRLQNVSKEVLYLRPHSAGIDTYTFETSVDVVDKIFKLLL